MTHPPPKAYVEVSKRDRQRALLYVILVAAAISAAAILIAPLAGPLGLALTLLAVAGIGVFFLVRWHARTFAYRCSRCGHEFVISALTDFVSPHVPDKKYLRCPSCRKRDWATILVQTREE